MAVAVLYLLGREIHLVYLSIIITIAVFLFFCLPISLVLKRMLSHTIVYTDLLMFSVKISAHPLRRTHLDKHFPANFLKHLKVLLQFLD